MDSRLFEFTPHAQASLLGDLPTQPRAIRQYADPFLQGAIDAAVERAGSKHGAVVAHFDDDKNVTLSVVGRIGNHWSVAAAAFKPWHGKLSYAAEVVYDW